MKKYYLIITTALLVLLFSGVVSGALTDNSKYYYKLDDGSGTNASDSADSLGIGLTSSSMWTNQSKLGGYALKPAGGVYGSWGDTTTFNRIHQGNGNWSLNLWYYMDGNLTSNNLMLCSTVGGDRNGIQLSGTNNYMYFHIGTSTGPYTGSVITYYNTSLNASRPGYNNSWHMFTVTCNLSAVDYVYKVYIDGVLSTQMNRGPGAYNAGNAFSNMIVGTYFDGGAGYAWETPLDEIGYWERGLSSSEVSTLYNSGVGIQYPFANNMITPLAPLNNTVYDRQTNTTLIVGVEGYSNINVSFYWSNNTLIGTVANKSNGQNASLNVTGLTPNQQYCWFANVTTVAGNTPTWCFTPNNEPKVRNLRIDDINASTFLIKWDNELDMQWFSASIGSDISEVRFITGIYNNWSVSNIIPNKAYLFTFQVGDNASAISDYYSFTFRSFGWQPNLTSFPLKRIITVNSTIVASDKANYAVNLTLNETNFRYCDMFACYPSFTKLNYTNGNDIRFMDYHDDTPLKYNITYWSVPGEGGISYSIIPDEFAPTGDWVDYNNTHDGDWNTNDIPNTYGEDYFNYTIPANTKTDSLFRIYAGEWGYDLQLPLSCYGGSKLRFKTTANYTSHTIFTYCQNNSDSTWLPVWYTLNSRLLYETMMTWNYNCRVDITVMPEFFNDSTQTYTSGVDGDYDEKVLMYYGNPSAPSNKTNVGELGLIQGATSVGGEIDYVINPPVIFNVNDTNGLTSTGVNISWSVDQAVDNRLRYASNPYLLGSIWTSRQIVRTEYINSVQGNARKTFKLDVIPVDYLGISSVTCSNTSYNSNYSINSTASPVEITFPNLNTSEFLNWTINYNENKTRYRNTDSANFKLEDLVTNTTYYYEINAYGVSANTTRTGTFTLGTPPSTPSGVFFNYTENRPSKEVTICFNVTNLNSNPSINFSVQYWNEASTVFNETTTTTSVGLGVQCKTISVDYNHNYSYRAKMKGTS